MVFDTARPGASRACAGPAHKQQQGRQVGAASWSYFLNPHCLSANIPSKDTVVLLELHHLWIPRVGQLNRLGAQVPWWWWCVGVDTESTWVHASSLTLSYGWGGGGGDESMQRRGVPYFS